MPDASQPNARRIIRLNLLLASMIMAVVGLLAVVNVIKIGPLAGYLMIGIGLIDFVVAMVIFRDREA